MFAATLDAGLLAAAATIIVAMIGWMVTRQTDSSKMQGDYMREINQDNHDMRDRIDALETKNRELDAHVTRCDADNEMLRQRVAALEAVLRRLLGNDIDGLDGL